MCSIVKNTPDIGWYKNGVASIKGDLLYLFNNLEAMFLSWAHKYAATELMHPSFILASELKKIDYFSSFPHLATFAISLDADQGKLEEFINSGSLDNDGHVLLTKTCPIDSVLTPASCYHVFIDNQNKNFNKTEIFTLRNICYRREASYTPLRRQWAFNMREIVVIGREGEVKEVLLFYRKLVEEFFAKISLPIVFQPATDPFYDPTKNPKYVMQKIDSLKEEMVFNNDLAIGSINFHRDFFGQNYNISIDSSPIFSGCIAFGLERWLYAYLEAFGSKREDWQEKLLS